MGKLDDIARKIGSEIKRVQDDLDSKIQVVQEETQVLKNNTNEIEFQSHRLDAQEGQIGELDANIEKMTTSFNEASSLIGLLPQLQELIDLLPEIREHLSQDL